jgi:hypothetical protein
MSVRRGATVPPTANSPLALCQSRFDSVLSIGAGEGEGVATKQSISKKRNANEVKAQLLKALEAKVAAAKAERVRGYLAEEKKAEDQKRLDAEDAVETARTEALDAALAAAQKAAENVPVQSKEEVLLENRGDLLMNASSYMTHKCIKYDYERTCVFELPNIGGLGGQDYRCRACNKEIFVQSDEMKDFEATNVVIIPSPEQLEGMVHKR